MLAPIGKPPLKPAEPEPNRLSISTRRRGDAETSAEKTQASQNLRTRRKRRNAGWRHRPCAEVGTCFGARGGSFALLLVAALLHPAAPAATRPQYGGTLRVELRQNAETPDPPALLGGGFTIARWEAGRLAVYEADENAGGGSLRHTQRAAATAGRNLRRTAAAVAFRLRFPVPRGGRPGTRPPTRRR